MIGSGGEDELRDDVQVRAGSTRVLVLARERLAQDRLADGPVTFGMTGDADLSNAVFFEQPGIEDLQSAVELADGLSMSPATTSTCETPASPTSCPSRSSSAAALSIRRATMCGTGSMPSRRSRPASATVSCGLGAWHVRDVQLRASGHDVGVPLDPLRLADGGFDGKALDEILNRLFVQCSQRLWQVAGSVRQPEVRTTCSLSDCSSRPPCWTACGLLIVASAALRVACRRG